MAEPADCDPGWCWGTDDQRDVFVVQKKGGARNKICRERDIVVPGCASNIVFLSLSVFRIDCDSGPVCFPAGSFDLQALAPG